MKNQKKITLSLILAIFTLSLVVLTNLANAQTEIDTKFNPNNIISDSDLLDARAMNLPDIQNFLQSKNSYLANYIAPNNNGVMKTAAEIIYDATNRNFDCSGVTLSDTPTEEEKRLNDFIAKRIAASQEPSQPTLLDKLKGNSFKKLHGNIPLHQKFKFQNDLFAGNADDFNNAIALIDQAPDYHEALALIKSRFVLKYDWDFSHETTLEFIGMVEDKYD